VPLLVAVVLLLLLLQNFAAAWEEVACKQATLE
jgi:hypothetical protein